MSEREAVQSQIDETFYSLRYLWDLNTDPTQHYLTEGARRGFNPNAEFCTQHYLGSNPDVRAAQINPLAHFVQSGRSEGRIPAPAASPIQHLLMDIDAVESATGTCFDPLRLPPPFDEKEYPLGFGPARIDAPILLLVEDTPRLDLIAIRMRQAADATFGNIYVLMPDDLVERLPPPMDDQVEILSVGEADLMAARLRQLLADLDASHAVIWNARVSPGILALPLLEGTARLRPDSFCIGSTLMDWCGRIHRSGRCVAADGVIQPEWQGNDIEGSPAYRLRTTDIAEPLLGLVNLALWRELNAAVADSPVPDVDTLFRRLSHASARAGHAIHVQGCAVAVAAQPPPDPDLEPQCALDFVRAAQTRLAGEAIAFIDAQVPTPDKDAGSVTAVNFIDICIERGASVYFHATVDRGFDPHYMAALAARGVICLCKPECDGLDAVLNRIDADSNSRLIFILTRIYSGGAHLETVRSRFPRAKIIFNTVDLHGLRELREAELAGNAAEIFAAQETFAREKDLIRRSNATILLSTQEIDVLKEELGYADLRLIPMINEFHETDTRFEDRRDMAFIGSFVHTPNVDAICYFLEELWDPIRDRLPDIRFKIVGAGFPDDLKTGLPEGVDLMGFVPDLTALLEQLRLTVAPLRYGAGIKGKIGTSLSHGVPCVGTALAVEGMGLSDGENILVADTPSEFADAVARLYTDAELWSRLSRSGYEFCEERFSRRAVSMSLNALLDDLFR